ncbi:hypothetical protein TrST_g12152 [Triparma strigata]|uniref:Uncharacterized protein n=1 Tax=Triparma strigata TaxID=1606541 RepID=A0A9W7B235_9STRA|nr:hypothetical protein TrST_g12152 [Triparma strigata]
MFPIPSHLPATIVPATQGSESHSFKLGLVRGFEQPGIQSSVNQQLTMQREISIRAKVLKKKKRSKNGRTSKQNKFSLERPSSLMYDGTVAPTDSQTLNTGANTGGEGQRPMNQSSWNEIVKKEKAERLERLSTPLWKKKPVPSHSLTALLGDKNVFTPNIASRQSLLSSEASRLSSPIQNQQSVMSNHSTAGGRLSPASQLSGLEKPSLSSGHSRQHRRASIDMTAKSNNVPLLQTFNKYKRKQTKRTKDEVQKLRDALKPKVTIVNEDGEKVEQIEEVMLIDQPSPRTLLTKANTWKAPFTDLHGTFYDSDLEDGEGEGEGEGSTSEQVRQLKYNLFAHYHSF